MISRILVPENLAPVTPEPTGTPAHRASTFLDNRQLIPIDMPVHSLDTTSTIPTHVPLDVLAAKLVVPRDTPATPLPDLLPSHAPRTQLDSRVAIPRDAQPRGLEIRSPLVGGALPEVLDRDVFTTGEVNLLTKSIEEEFTGWQVGGWQARISSIVFHTMIVALFLLQPKLFPFKGPSAEQVELARKTMNLVYLPPADPGPPLMIAAPPARTSPQMRIDPDVLRKVAPDVEPDTRPEPKEEARADRGGELTAPPSQPSHAEPGPPRELAPASPPPAPNPRLSPFALPRQSAGRALEDSLRGAAREGSAARALGFGGSVPSGVPGSGGGQVYGNLEMLTPTEGVDFTHYLARVLASVKRNWYAVIPESAKLGEKGIVVLEFRIMKNGAVPYAEPALRRGSGREPLDRAAMASIRASNPFEPLPGAFSGPFIALRFTFLYNLPIEAAQ